MIILFRQIDVKLTMRHLKPCSHVLWSVVKLWGSPLHHSLLCHDPLLWYSQPWLHNPRLGDSWLWLCDPRLCEPRLCYSWL